MPDRKQPDPSPPNAFTSEYLHGRSEEDEVSTALEADYAGPWLTSPLADGWAVHRWWEEPGAGDAPYALFSDRQAAMVAVTALHSRGRRGLFRLNPKREGGGFEVFRDAETVGRMAIFDEETVEAMSVLDALLRDPTALARLLQAAGHTALLHTGKILVSKGDPSAGASAR